MRNRCDCIERCIVSAFGRQIAVCRSVMWTKSFAILILSGAAYAGDFSAGIQCYEAKDYNCAIREWQPLADRGIAQAQYNLALIYSRGEGVAQDVAKAAGLFEKAANIGIVQAQYNLAQCYLNGSGVPKDEDKAISWFQKAAELGDPNAANNLGTILEGRKDYDNAAKWYLKAADEGLAMAQFNVGQMFDLGRGFTQDFAKAAEFYERAAQQGDAGALCNLAILYYNGEGVKIDRLKAYEYFLLAGKAGDTRASSLLGRTANKLQKKQITEAEELAKQFEASHPFRNHLELSAPEPIMNADSKVTSSTPAGLD